MHNAHRLSAYPPEDMYDKKNPKTPKKIQDARKHSECFTEGMAYMMLIGFQHITEG